MSWIAVGIGGALGSLARHGANIAVNRLLGTSVPYATMFVNLVGCFAIGLFAGLVAVGTWKLDEHARAFLFVGILGGFTTFSSFGLDTMTLVRSGATGVAIANVFVQVTVGLLSVFAGYWVARGA